MTTGRLTVFITCLFGLVAAFMPWFSFRQPGDPFSTERFGIDMGLGRVAGAAFLAATIIVAATRNRRSQERPRKLAACCALGAFVMACVFGLIMRTANNGHLAAGWIWTMAAALVLAAATLFRAPWRPMR